MPMVQEWSEDHLETLTALVQDSFPRDEVSPDELLSCVWDDPGIVLGLDDGTGAVSVVFRDDGGESRGIVKLLAVHPGARRQGLGRGLLESAWEWSRGQGASALDLDRAPPFYLWPGVDVNAMPGMLCLSESCGFVPTGANMTMSLPVTFRAGVPEGFEVRQVLDEGDVAPVVALVSATWPDSLTAIERAIEQGTCLATFEDADGPARVVGLICHSLNRAGWIEPIGVAPSSRHRGIGSALLGKACTDLMVANHRDAEVAVPDPTEFYVKAGGSVSRVFRTYRKKMANREQK